MYHKEITFLGGMTDKQFWYYTELTIALARKCESIDELIEILEEITVSCYRHMG